MENEAVDNQRHNLDLSESVERSFGLQFSL